MPEKPNQSLLREKLSGALAEDVKTLKTILSVPLNKDIIFRDFFVADVRACAVFIDGMAGGELINEFILEACRAFPTGFAQVEPRARAESLDARIVTVADSETGERFEELTGALLSGKTALLLDGCPEALLLETRKYDKRGVGHTTTESVIMGAQEGFVENLRTNVTLIRRIIRSEALIGESLTVGQELPTKLALIYIKGAANERALDCIRRRILSLNVKQCPGSGYLQQLIEDNPFSLFPQMLQTERPDRAASCLSDGQIVLLVEGSPFALVAPVSLFHLLHASDDSFMRWQYGTFLRIVRTLGMVISLFLPGIYVAITTYHAHMLPLDLLRSIAETRVMVPFSVFVEVVIMEVAFYLINEAGTRIPSLVGPALSIVGGLILGQAAVSARIISPILIIVIAATGLGNFTVPNYSMGFGLQILRLFVIIASVIWGIYGVILSGCLIACATASLTSFGEPFLAPVAPYRPHNPDIILRLPIWLQRTPLYLMRKGSWLAGERGKARGWRRKR